MVPYFGCKAPHYVLVDTPYESQLRVLGTEKIKLICYIPLD
jgi:hypothetical protein